MYHLAFGLNIDLRRYIYTSITRLGVEPCHWYTIIFLSVISGNRKATWVKLLKRDKVAYVEVLINSKTKTNSHSFFSITKACSKQANLATDALHGDVEH